MKIELRPHQAEAIEKMHNGCVLWGGVGTGKTITALAYSQLREAGKKIVVITTAKKRDSRDWETEAALMALPVDDIEVSSWNKIKDYEKTEGLFFIFDEQRLVGSGAWVKSFYKIAKRNNWILLSATPGDTWNDYAPLFIANGWYKNITEFRRTHAIYSQYTSFPKIERYIGQGRLQKYRKHLLVEMPMARHTTRHMHYVECDWDQELLDLVRKKRWNVYEHKPLKNAAELFSVMRKVVSTDESRTSQMAKLIGQRKKLIVFYNYNYELEILRDLLSSVEKTSKNSSDSSCSTLNGGFSPLTTQNSLDETNIVTSSGMLLPFKSCLLQDSPTKSTNSENKSSTEKAQTFGWAEWNGHKHEPIPKTDRWVYLVQYSSGSEGWNCTETDAMAFWSLTYSWKQFNQAQGRIDRMNTPFTDLHYYIMMTNSHAEKPVIRSLQMKKDFQPK